MSNERRFFSRVQEVGDCWVWQGPLYAGYGRFWSEGRHHQAHRWLYEVLVVELPSSLQLDHLCRNRACVNPEHLEPVTGRVNTLRGETLPAENIFKMACPQGHPYAGENLRVTPSGRRVCRACHRVNAANSRRRAA